VSITNHTRKKNKCGRCDGRGWMWELLDCQETWVCTEHMIHAWPGKKCWLCLGTGRRSWVIRWWEGVTGVQREDHSTPDSGVRTSDR
jgi:hypothetical protein